MQLKQPTLYFVDPRNNESHFRCTCKFHVFYDKYFVVDYWYFFSFHWLVKLLSVCLQIYFVIVHFISSTTFATVSKKFKFHNHPWRFKNWSCKKYYPVLYVNVNFILSSLYWIPKLQKCRFKQRYIARSFRWYTKPFPLIGQLYQLQFLWNYIF